MKKGRIYNIIRWLTPYGIVNSYVEKNYWKNHGFLEGLKQYVESGQQCELVENSPYETIVSVQGFGYSGSGAVVDLLREYDSTHVIGYVDYEGSNTSRNFKCNEVNILRFAGGLFEVERFIGSNNISQNDALLHRIVAQFESSDIYRNNPTIRPYCYEFMSQICEMLYEDTNFRNYQGIKDTLFLKRFSIIEYREWCRKLLNSIFAEIQRATGEKSILVLDQIVNDMEFDTKRYKDYIPNLKIIVVYRDPRDVYSFACKTNVRWIPHSSADVFIKWYKILMRHFNVHEQKAYCVVQFEKLIEEYDVVIERIEHFIGLQANEHTKKKMCLDVSKSQENVYLWKENMSDNNFEAISTQLPDLCY